MAGDHARPCASVTGMGQDVDPGGGTSAAVVAFYADSAPPGLDSFVTEVQGELTDLLGESFRPRDVATTHTTVIGLDLLAPLLGSGDLPRDLARRAPGDLDGFCRRLQDLVDTGDHGVRFGGVADEEGPFASRGRRLHQRMIGVDHGQVVLVGWPIDDRGTPTSMLDEWRVELARFGVRHRYPLPDPDAHMVLGRLDPRIGTDVASRALGRLRAHLTSYSCFVPLGRDQLRVIVYDDPTVPLKSTRVLPLGRLLGAT